MARKKRTGEFGDRLVALRRAGGFTQMQLARRTGISQRAISSYETQASYPPVPLIAALARGLGVSADELLGLKKPSKTGRKQPDARVRWLRKKLEQILTLPERDQRAVIRLINSLSGARGNGCR